jgi:hypothetical protein
MVFVGLERFVHHCQRDEIRGKLLHEEGVDLSSGEISNLAKLFLKYLEDLQTARSKQFRSALADDGGWPLHVDATGENGRGTLLVVLAGWRRWVAGSWKIQTERADIIRTCLDEVVGQFGPPCAVMRDLGRAMIPAVNDFVTEHKLDIPVLSCHQHFLADIGSDLLLPAHGELRALFRRQQIRPKLRRLTRDLGRKLGEQIGQARGEVKDWQQDVENAQHIPQGRAGIATVRTLAQWVLDYQADSSGEDFPFDRPYLQFYERSERVHRASKKFLQGNPRDQKVERALRRLERILEPVAADVPFRQIVKRLRARSKLFDELRSTLRLVEKGSYSSNKNSYKEALTSEQAAEELSDIRYQLDRLTESLKERRSKRGPAEDMREAIDIVLKHIKDHGDSLWGHVISLPEKIGGGIRLVERTNFISEDFFGILKHNERRRSGRKNLSQDLEHLPAGAAKACNLNFPDYVEILCGSLDFLAKAFAQLDLEKRHRMQLGEQLKHGKSRSTALNIESSSLSIADKRLIRTDDMRKKINSVAKARAPYFLKKLQVSTNQATAK